MNITLWILITGILALMSWVLGYKNCLEYYHKQAKLGHPIMFKDTVYQIIVCDVKPAEKVNPNGVKHEPT